MAISSPAWATQATVSSAPNNFICYRFGRASGNRRPPFFAALFPAFIKPGFSHELLCFSCCRGGSSVPTSGHSVLPVPARPVSFPGATVSPCIFRYFIVYTLFFFHFLLAILIRNTGNTAAQLPGKPQAGCRRGAGQRLPSFCCKRHGFFWHLPPLTFPPEKPILTVETFDSFLSSSFLYLYYQARRTGFPNGAHRTATL